MISPPATPTVDDMDDSRFLLSDETLWTRTTARAKRAALLKIIDRAKPGQTVVVDAEGLKAFDHSFASEFFSKTLRELPVSYPGVFLVVEHLGEFPTESLEVTLERDRQILLVRAGASLKLIGDHHPADQATIDAIAAEPGPVSAAELSARLGVSINAMNERLAKLARFGLVHRVEGTSPAGRRQFAYQTASR